MRNEFLRDVMAGSAGVLVVLALIGLPKDPTTTHQVQVQWQGIRVMPYYSRGPLPGPGVVRPIPPKPVP